MGNLKLVMDMDSETTTISNLFIDEYLAEANDAQIKVYLYLLRMTGAKKATSISDMADKFNHTEKDVCRALKYWEKKGLLSLAYDAIGSIVGISVHSAAFAPMRGSSPSVTPIATITPTITYNNMYESPVQPVAEPQPEEPAVDVPRFNKRMYSVDELRAFKNNDETSQLIFIAEQYLKRTLKPSDIQSLLFITDELEFSEDLIDHLLQYCVGKGKRDFRYIETVAIAWAEKGITTPKEAQEESSSYDENIYTVMKALGKDSKPTEVEIDYIRKWRNEFGFNTDVILEACKRTVLSTDKGRFRYANKILEAWCNAGVTDAKDIASEDAKFKTASANTAKKPAANTTFHQFSATNTYDFSQMEDFLLNN